MKKRANIFVVVLLAMLGAGAACAQQLPGSVSATLFPSTPTSADNLKLIIGRPCSSFLPYKADAYRLSMSQNNITVIRGEIVGGIVPGACPVSPRDEIDLGRLPAGNYTVTVIDAATAIIPSTTVVANAPFTVTDARATKTAPYVRLDYSGHWWDPNDSGWGLFIWHDARDNVLAAWFTYTPDGKPMWYVFQPTWTTSSSTVTTPLLQTSRLPGPTSPPPAPTSYATVGSASLDFTNLSTADEGKLTYTFTGGAQQVRNIQRFKP